MDLWQQLKTTVKPILLYGMGNGADKILDHARRLGIPISGTFASDAFVRGQSFRGMQVMTYRDAKARFGDMVVLLAFASPLPDVITAIEAIAAEQELYVPDVPVAGETVFDEAFYTSHAAEFSAARALLADAQSLAIFDGVLEGKLTGSLPALLSAAMPREEIFRSLLSPSHWQRYADLGAYDGDTIREFLSYAPDWIRITAMEPDPKNFRRLQATLSSLGIAERVHAVQAAAWDKADTLFFDASGNRNAGLHTPSEKRVAVSAMPPDALLLEEGIDLIKYDVEGAEREALLGSAETIARYTPDLIVSCYHRSEDLYALPLLVHSLSGGYRFYLRRTRCLPAWEISLIAVSQNR